MSVADAVAAARYGYVNEDELQAGLAQALVAAGHDVTREVRLSGRDRVDLLVDRTAVEVKIAGTPERVLAQLARYAECEWIDDLVLVTTRARHRNLPPTVGGKPLRVVVLGGAGR